ncbi:MAG: bifunctional DNA-binding transcriptional regulator/O6-methylguanine-DNA methyltransferase Ada [Hyphomicrobiales bacterium]|nr:bifunctional DNA-binding transcriptional regulator/O6-methylguanine-DNA methyltransferase Ada [Hyphomicrobiales bacterium]
MPAPLDIVADPRWRAVVERDPAAADAFVYAVVTTGIYCRPTCAARPPRPENVRLYADAAAAERAGFRACKRCRPADAPASERRAALVARACAMLSDEDDPLDAAAVAATLGVSLGHLHRIFKESLGVTPGAYARARRSQRALRGLASGESVTRAMHEAGFSSSSRFHDAVARRLGVKPKAFAKGGQGETIRFAVGPCSLGHALIAATAKGVCAILLGDDPQTLVDDLRSMFSQAELVGADAAFEELAAVVIAHIDDPRAPLALPLDIRGAAFQERVWKALRAIPPGETRSYAELAATIGAPGSARAVARACASNCLAVVTPCHRVIRADGGLSGYRWGVERKAALLAREGAKV